MTSFARLPPELLCRIFELLPDPSTISALTLTSRFCHSIWLTHSHRIAANITSRIIPHLIDAEKLATAQEDDEAYLPRNPPSHQRPRHLQVLSRLRRLLRNAHLASLVCDSWARDSLFRDSPYPPNENLIPNTSEPPDFRPVFYSLWILALMSQRQSTTALRGCTQHELSQLNELTRFISHYRDDLEDPATFRDVRDAGLDFRDDMWAEVCDEVEYEFDQLSMVM